MLIGWLSPLGNIGSEKIHFERLLTRAADPTLGGSYIEVILTTNFTGEGETTARYIGEILKAHGIEATRPTRGMPIGDELEYVDAGTTTCAVLD